jgi:hypothetical protein
MLSVVHAIQPHPGLSLSSTSSDVDVTIVAFDARRSSSRRGISWMPIENSGLSLCGGAVDARRSLTASGIFERTERS